jgi:hypothetical protein
MMFATPGIIMERPALRAIADAGPYALTATGVALRRRHTLQVAAD